MCQVSLAQPRHIKIFYSRKVSESMQSDLTQSSAVVSLESQNQMTGPSSDIEDGGCLTIEGPEIVTYRDILYQFVGSKLTSVTLGPQCRSCDKLNLLTLPRTIDSVDTAGNKIWFFAAGAAIVISLQPTTFIHFDVNSAAQRHIALIIETTLGQVIVADKRMYVWAAVMDERDLRRTVLDKTLISVINVRDIEALCRCAKDNASRDETAAEAICRSHVVTGIGPRLASEGFYSAAVSPWRIARDVYSKEWERFFLRVHEHWWESRQAMLAAATLERSWKINTSVWMHTVINKNAILREKCAKNFVLCWCPAVQR